MLVFHVVRYTKQASRLVLTAHLTLAFRIVSYSSIQLTLSILLSSCHHLETRNL